MKFVIRSDELRDWNNAVWNNAKYIWIPLCADMYQQKKMMILDVRSKRKADLYLSLNPKTWM